MTDQAVDSDGGRVATPADGDPAQQRTPRQLLGRTRELKELQADIERAGLDTLAGRKAPRARVLLIAGRPGSGRSALAAELARKVAPRYPDGILTARLTEPDGTPVPTARTARELLAALGPASVPGAAEDDLTASLRDALAGRRALLILDDAHGAEQVDALLPDTPDCLAIAVSEGPLTGIADVRPCTLGGLDTASAVRLLTHYTGSVRVTCDPVAAETLTELCGAQPAALLLAGGWLAARPKASVADLVKRLRDDPGEGPALHRVFRRVYADMPTQAARTLRLLAFSPAGLADPHTASALAGCSVTDAHAALDDFVSYGLLRAVDSPLPQYQVPDCLVPLLTELATAEDRPAEIQLARARLLERTVRLLNSCRAVTEPQDSEARRQLAALPRTLRFPSRTAAARWLRLRRPALLAAARGAVRSGDLDTLARRLLAALARALMAHYGSREAAAELYGIHEMVLDVAERRGLHRERAAALLNLADLDTRTGRTHDALTRYRGALDAGRLAGDFYATGRAMESIGAAHQALGDWQRAGDWFGRALTQRLGREEHADAARLYGRLAGALSQQGRHEDALRNWRASATGHRRTGDAPAQARALGELARVLEYAGRPAESLRTCHEAVEWARHAGDPRLQAALGLRLADTYERLGDPAAARLHRVEAGRLLGETQPQDAPARPAVPAQAAPDREGAAETEGAAEAEAAPEGAPEAEEEPPASGEDEPGEEVPGGEAPGQEAPREDASCEDPSGEDAPGEDRSAEGASAEGTPAEHMPAEDAPAEEAGLIPPASTSETCASVEGK